MTSLSIKEFMGKKSRKEKSEKEDELMNYAVILVIRFVLYTVGIAWAIKALPVFLDVIKNVFIGVGGF